MVISKTHLGECMKIVKKHVISNFFVQTCMCRRCRRKDAFCESIGNALKETVLSWIINTIYIVLPLYQCPYTPSRQRFSLSLEAFSGAITFNVRVYFKHNTPFQTEVFSKFGTVLRSDNIQRPSLFQTPSRHRPSPQIRVVMLEINSNVECYRP